MTAPQLAREPLDDLSRWLRWAVIVTAGCAALGLALPGAAGRGIATAAVVVIIAAPLLRVVWLIVAWARSGDWRFVRIGCGLLAVIAVGSGVAIVA